MDTATDAHLFTLPRNAGPIHLVREAGPHGILAWCGVRQHFNHLPLDGTVQDATCRACRRHHATQEART